VSRIETLLWGLLVTVVAIVPGGHAGAQTSSPSENDDRPVVYLTFDSGPGPRTTEYLDVLDQWDAKATFFVIGRNAQASPQMLREIVRRGHAVGNHTWTHRDLTELPPLEAQTELHVTNRFVAETVGLDVRCWRPPFGENSDGLKAGAAKVGLSNNSWIESGRWDVDTVDWKFGYEFVLARLQTIQAGDVVLMHGGMNPDYEDLAALMTWFEANGERYRFESLPGCGPTAIPASLGAVDPDTNFIDSDPALWFEIRRAAPYLNAFGKAQ